MTRHASSRAEGLALVASLFIAYAMVGPVVASDPRPGLDSPGERRAFAALRHHLSEPELERLLAHRDVALAVSDLMDGWDGQGDELRVHKRDGRVVLDLVLRQRRCRLTLDAGPEATRPDHQCELVVTPDGERSLDLDPRLWQSPASVSVKPRRAPRPAPAQPRQPQDDTWGEAPIEPPTVLRRVRHPDSPFESELLTEARIAHERLRERLAGPSRHDPMLPRHGETPAMDAAEALAPLLWAESGDEAASVVALRNPFGAGRMQTDIPVPLQHTLSGTPGPPMMPSLSDECEVSWRLRERSEDPPELACYRSYAWHKKLDANSAYKVLETLTMFLDIPLAKTFMAIIAEDTKSSRAHELVWAFVWLEWVGRAPDDERRIAYALSRLSSGERRYLRKQLAGLWGKPNGLVLASDPRTTARSGEPMPTMPSTSTPAHTLITRLYERHFLDLYPEARDLDGLPRSAFVTDTWLWANNWLSILEGRSVDAIAKAYHRLAERERRVIDAFVREPMLAQRWARVPQVIARL